MDWEMSLINASDPPAFLALTTFLETRIQALQNMGAKPERSSAQTPSSTNKLRPGTKTVVTSVETARSKFLVCKQDHPLHRCPKFTGMQPANRMEFVRTNRLCINCLYQGHFPSKCRSQSKCRTCHAQHNSLLHEVPNLRFSSTSATTMIQQSHQATCSWRLPKFGFKPQMDEEFNFVHSWTTEPSSL